MFSLFNLLMYLFITGFTPGPNTISSFSNATKFGFKKTLPFIFGLWVGIVSISICSMFLLQKMSAIITKIEKPLTVIASIYILYLAYKIYKSSNLVSNKIENKNENGLSFLKGLLLQFVNPKVYLFTILSIQTYIMPFFKDNYFMLFLFSLLLGSTAVLANLTWALFGTILNILFSKYGKITNTILAILLAYCGISILF